jgi:hypothetical protein
MQDPSDYYDGGALTGEDTRRAQYRQPGPAPEGYQWNGDTGEWMPVAVEAPVAPAEQAAAAAAPTPMARPTYNGPSAPNLNVGNAPEFNFSYDSFKAPDPFKAPDWSEIANDPGYQFRQKEGLNAVERSAAGKGTLRSGGTLKDIASWGQGLASQEYGNVFNRAQSTYDMNYDNLRSAYDSDRGFGLNVAQAQYAPKLATWQTQAAANVQGGMAGFNRAWDVFQDQTGWYDDYQKSLLAAGSA